MYQQLMGCFRTTFSTVDFTNDLLKHQSHKGLKSRHIMRYIHPEPGHKWQLDSPGPLGGEKVVLHLVFEWNERSDGVKQGQALWFVDNQLQVPNKHRQVHRPEGEEGDDSTLQFNSPYL